jgi:DNA-binding MarR family transcriptional regulator
MSAVRDMDTNRRAGMSVLFLQATGVYMMDRFELAKRIRESSVNPTAKAIGAALCARWMEGKGFAVVKASTLADELGRSRKTVLRALNDLVAAGLIGKQKTTRASLYTALSPEREALDDLLEGTKMSTHKPSPLSPSWRDHYPALAGMSDQDFETMCRDTTNAAQLSDLTGWSMETLLDIHPDWIAAQLSTLTLCKQDRTDGINGSRFLDLVPDSHINPLDKGESTKRNEAILGYQRDLPDQCEGTIVSTLNIHYRH